MMIFLYFFQIMLIQERLQAAITEAGRNTAKYAYVIQEFIKEENLEKLNSSLYGSKDNFNYHELKETVLDSSILKLRVKDYISMDQINRSCIKGGYDGILFYESSVMDEEDCIDIVLRYQMKIPFNLFGLEDLNMIQRVRLRGWTGHQVAAAYGKEEDEGTQDTLVYITETGTVYHTNKNCSHLRLSIRPVQGLPTNLRNDNGAIYHSCELCGHQETESDMTYITTDGTRYHRNINCSGLKRTIISVPLSEVSDRKLCKRCSKQ
jgi:hypothetical protein